MADTGIDVTSGGTRALVGRPMDPGSSRLLELGGVPAQDFRARQLAREMVAEADLVLAAAREHRSVAARLFPPAMRAITTSSPWSSAVAPPGSRPVCGSTCAWPGTTASAAAWCTWVYDVAG